MYKAVPYKMVSMLTLQPISVLICVLKILTFMERTSTMAIILVCRPAQLLDFLLTLSLEHAFLSVIQLMDYMGIQLTGDVMSFALLAMVVLSILNV